MRRPSKPRTLGFSMGIAGTEVAKEASSIILLDDNFSSIVTALMWGRAVNDAVKKFLQFQITVNITAVILTFVSAVSNSANHSVLSAVQLLWVNLIMDTLAALALATDAPTPSILDRPPERKGQGLISVNMWKMISGQAVYQLIITFVLYFAGPHFLPRSYTPAQIDTMVFNTFVWMQVFNQYNSRRLDNKFNIFEGVMKNYWFIGINVLMVAGQIMIVFVGGKAFGVTRISGAQWGICLALSAPCLLWALALRCVPDQKFQAVFDGVSRAMDCVGRPLGRVVGAVAKPVGKMGRAIRRSTKSMLGKKATQTEVADANEMASAPRDEEACPNVVTK